MGLEPFQVKVDLKRDKTVVLSLIIEVQILWKTPDGCNTNFNLPNRTATQENDDKNSDYFTVIIIVCVRNYLDVKRSKKKDAARLSSQEIIFDKLPLEVRLAVYNLEKAEETARANKTEMEKAKAQKALEFSITFEKLLDDNTLLAPRVVVEFVGTFVMHSLIMSTRQCPERVGQLFSRTRTSTQKFYFVYRKRSFFGKRCKEGDTKSKRYVKKSDDDSKRYKIMYTSDYHHQTSLHTFYSLCLLLRIFTPKRDLSFD